MGLGWADRLGVHPPQGKGKTYLTDCEDGQRSKTRLTGKRKDAQGGGDRTKGLPKRSIFRIFCLLRQRRPRITQLNLKDGGCSHRDPNVHSQPEVETRLPLLSHFLRKCFFLKIKCQNLSPHKNGLVPFPIFCECWFSPFKIQFEEPSLVAHTCNPSTQDTETGGSWVQGQCGLQI
jgi:hypothetical protein